MEVKNGVKDEAAAQTEYETAKAAAEKLIETLEEKKVNLETDKAKETTKKEGEEETLAGNNEKLSLNEEYKKSITPDCDWMLNSFEERREKRKAEMNGLVTAKEYLAGGTPSMLQASAHFDDDKLQQIGFES